MKKTFVNDTLDKGLISKIYEEYVIRLNARKTNNLI